MGKRANQDTQKILAMGWADDPIYIYRILDIPKIKDGDTWLATIDLGFDISMRHTFRMHGYDTPETFRPSSESEHSHGKMATEFVKHFLADNPPASGHVYLISNKDLMGAYGRYEASIVAVPPGQIPVHLGRALEEANLLKDTEGYE